jgi:hypothetical protein
MVVTTSGMAGQPTNASPMAPAAAPTEPAAWEQLVDGALENKGLAQVERLGTRWVLNVFCGGTHATYPDDTALDLAHYSNGFVHARYKYVNRTFNDPKCFRAPCSPVRERRIALERRSRRSSEPGGLIS